VDDGQVGELRRWADGLTSDSRPEVKAAAKAILLLADELEAARSQLLEERLIRQALEATPESEDSDAEPPEEGGDVRIALLARLRGLSRPRFARRA
jgi:hypothetical protein